MNAPTDLLLLCWRDTDHPQGGGSERYLERVGAELVRRGARVTLLTARYPGSSTEEIRDGVRVLRAGGRLTVYPRVFATLVAARFGRGRLPGYRPAAVVDTQNGVPFFARLATPAPTIVLEHHCHREQWPVAGPVLAPMGWLIESRLSPWVHRRNRYITVSRPSAEELVELGVDAERITVVHGGIDPVPEGLEPPFRGTAQRLIVVARLVPHKQVEHAVSALAELRAAGRDVHLDIVGDGWWAPQLRELVRTRDLGDAVTFHGHVDDRRKHELLAAADLHLMPSAKEGWGLVVIEAAQHGVPTVGYRSSKGLVDSVVDGRTGVLVDDEAGLARVAGELLDEPRRLRTLGDAARERAAGYSWESTADGFERVLRAL